MQHIHMAVLPECDIEGCEIKATFDAPTHHSGNRKLYLCRTHYMHLGNKELPYHIIKLTHEVKVELEHGNSGIS